MPTGKYMAFQTYANQLGETPEPIHVSEYRQRQEKLYSQLDDNSALILCSPKEKIRSNDVHFPYRTNSDLLYLTGWKDPDCVLLAIKKDNVWTTTLFVQESNIELEIWEGRRPGVEGAKKNWAIDEAYPSESISKILSERLKSVSIVYHCVGFNIKVDNLVENSINSRNRARQQIGEGPTQRIDPSLLISEMRLIKSDAEINLMRYSANISSIAHIEAMKNCFTGIGEWQIQAIIEGYFKFLGAKNWAYPSIVGCGENATILHYHENNKICNDGEIILIDAGSEYEGYAADITRSWPISGKFSDSQMKIYNLVLKSQRAAIQKCVVGNQYLEAHIAASKVLAEGLVELGIIHCSAEEALENGELKKYFMHGTGHWLGLDVHDVGIYKPNGEPRVFEPGMVITIEPGLYFGDWRSDLTDLDPKWAGIGIRIEDDILITENGPEVLSSLCPKDIHELESLIGQSN